MALSNAERERRQKIDGIIASLSPNPETEPVPAPVNEAPDNKIRDLKTLEDLVKGSRFGYSQMGRFPVVSEEAAVNVAVLFLSNKNVKVPKDQNCVSMSFLVSDSNITVYSQSNPTTLEDFMELPKQVEGNTMDTIGSILDKCDCDAIYNAYQSEVLSIMQMYANTAYSMFSGANIYKRPQYDMETRGDGACTLYVGYDERAGKFRYAYNPRFILRSALEEYNMRRDRYRSLRDCYCYILAFFITHEMMHLITNNVTSSGSVSEVDLGDHRIENQIMDSFINCELSILFSRVEGINTDSQSLAPMPAIGINSKISVRAEHNVGLKKIKDVKELATTITEVLKGTLKLDTAMVDVENWGFRNRELSQFEGADVFIQVDVSSRAKGIRKNSIIYQKFVNDVIRSITSGKIYDRFAELSEMEQISDKSVLPNGTLVRIKGSVDICVIAGYDPDTKLYTLHKTDNTVNREQQKDGMYLCSYEYSDNGQTWGTALRSDFIPFDPTSRENTWVEGAAAQEKKKELSQEELEKAAQAPTNIFDEMERYFGEADSGVEILAGALVDAGKESDFNDAIDTADDLIEKCAGQDNGHVSRILGKDVFDRVCIEYNKRRKGAKLPDKQEDQTGGRTVNGGQDETPKVLNIGDIVYIRTRNTFGRIVSISNGQFELEEMREEQARTLDDTRFH